MLEFNFTTTFICNKIKKYMQKIQNNSTFQIQIWYFKGILKLLVNMNTVNL